MTIETASEWIADLARPGNVWFAKRLSANDTQANGSNQAGTYLPKALSFEVAPPLLTMAGPNPRIQIPGLVDSHAERREVSLIWYDGKRSGKTRDETRITGWGGLTSALLDPASTGSLAVFVFENEDEVLSSVRVWVCREIEDEVFEDFLGPVDPGRGVVWRFSQGPAVETDQRKVRSVALKQLPQSWLEEFPAPDEIVSKSIELRKLSGESADTRLAKRRDIEFELFKALERAVETPKVEGGFVDLDAFLGAAQSILQRRKSRSGRSLELQVRAILQEEGLIENVSFSHGKESDEGKKPDFLFPSAEKYRDLAYPPDKLLMLAAKTTAKDRWRQILNEADKIRTKHLLTLQEGVSKGQFREMSRAGVRLVVPKHLISKYHKDIRPELMSFEDFIALAKSLVI